MTHYFSYLVSCACHTSAIACVSPIEMPAMRRTPSITSPFSILMGASYNVFSNIGLHRVRVRVIPELLGPRILPTWLLQCLFTYLDALPMSLSSFSHFFWTSSLGAVILSRALMRSPILWTRQYFFTASIYLLHSAGFINLSVLFLNVIISLFCGLASTSSPPLYIF